MYISIDKKCVFYVFEIRKNCVYSREQRAERMCLHIHSATAARVEYPAAQLRYKFDVPSACCGVFDFVSDKNVDFCKMV